MIPHDSLDLCGHHGGKNRSGNPCRKPCIGGTKRCNNHAGKPRAKAKAEGAVVIQLVEWGLTDEHVEPGEQLLRIVAQSARRVELYSSLLARAYNADERLRALLVRRRAGETLTDEEAADLDAARGDLDQIMATGGIRALIGHTYGATKDGDIYATGEEVRGLARLEQEERKMLAKFAAQAVAAGLAERQVRLAEVMAVQLVAVVFGVLDDLGIARDDLATREAVSRRLMAVGGGPGSPQTALEGVVVPR